jgi:hypothetical protein
MTTTAVYPHDRARFHAGGNQARPGIARTARGWVSISLPGLLALLAHLQRHSSPAVALADAAALIVLLCDVADRNGRIAPKGGWRPHERFGYHHRLIAPASWDERRRRLVAADVLEVDSTGRVLAIAKEWHAHLTAKDEIGVDATAAPVPYVAVQRAELHALVEVLRGHRNDRGHARPGIGRLLIVLLVLCAPTVSRLETGAIVATQGQVAKLLGISRQSVHTAMGELVDLGLLAPPQRQRGPTATATHQYNIGETCDRLAGRHWVPDPALARLAPADGAPAPVEPSEASCQGPPSTSGGAAVGQEQHNPSGAHQETDRPNRNARGGPLQLPDWQLGPSSHASHAPYTHEAVARLRYNAGALRELLVAYDHKHAGQRLRAALRHSLDIAQRRITEYAVTGNLPNDADRDLVDAIARLARDCDLLLRLSVDVHAALADDDPAGLLSPLAAVRLMAARLRPYVRQARSRHDYRTTTGNWRRARGPRSSSDGQEPDGRTALARLLRDNPLAAPCY